MSIYGTALLDVDLSVEEFELETVVAEEIEVEIDTAINAARVIGDVYDGAYTVAPSFDEQLLETKDKVMIDDVTIEPILVSRTTNVSGGRTIYIGGIISG